MSQVLELLKQYGPALVALLVSYYRDQAIIARHKREIAELDRKLLDNKIAIEESNRGKSSDDIIDKYAPGAGVKP